MPEINVNVECEAEVNIEFYCAECGRGICSNASPGRTKRRGQPFFDITGCDCMKDRIKELEEENKDMENELEELRSK